MSTPSLIDVIVSRTWTVSIRIPRKLGWLSACANGVPGSFFPSAPYEPGYEARPSCFKDVWTPHSFSSVVHLNSLIWLNTRSSNVPVAISNLLSNHTSKWGHDIKLITFIKRLRLINNTLVQEIRMCLISNMHLIARVYSNSFFFAHSVGWEGHTLQFYGMCTLGLEVVLLWGSGQRPPYTAGPLVKRWSHTHTLSTIIPLPTYWGLPFVSCLIKLGVFLF